MVLDVAIFFERVRHLGNTMHDEVRRVMVSFAFLANVNSANQAEELLEEWRGWSSVDTLVSLRTHVLVEMEYIYGTFSMTV